MNTRGYRRGGSGSTVTVLLLLVNLTLILLVSFQLALILLGPMILFRIFHQCVKVLTLMQDIVVCKNFCAFSIMREEREIYVTLDHLAQEVCAVIYMNCMSAVNCVTSNICSE